MRKPKLCYVTVLVYFITPSFNFLAGRMGRKLSAGKITTERPATKPTEDNWMVSNSLPDGSKFDTIQLSTANFAVGLCQVRKGSSHLWPPTTKT